jgi:rhomboid family GlyGly-CTERM serine protease
MLHCTESMRLSMRLMSPRHLFSTPAERLAAAGVALIALLACFPAAGPALQYQRDELSLQPWRLFTAHLVHVNARHVLLNAVVWLVFARLFAPELGARRQALACAVGAAAIGAGLAAFYPQVGWYRGASGVLYTLFFTGSVAWLGHALRTPRQDRWRRLALPALLTVGGWAKLIWELPRAGALPFNPWLDAPVVPQAHLLGAAAGTLLAVVLLLGERPPATAGPAQSRSPDASSS